MTKLSISNAWDETRRILGRDGGLLVTVALALMVLPGVISDMVTPPAPPGQMPDPGIWLVVAISALLIGLIGQLSIAWLAVKPGTSVGEAIRHGFGRAPWYILATMIWILPFVLLVAPLVGGLSGEARSPAAAIGFLVLLPLFIFFFVRMMITGPVAAVENRGPVAILRRSWDLTRGRWFKLFAFFVLFFIAAFIVMAAVAAVAGLVAAFVFGDIEPFSVGALLVSLLGQLAGAAVTVMFVVMLARIYVQLAGSSDAEVSVPTSGS